MIQWNELDEPIPAKILMLLDLSDCTIMSPLQHEEFCNELGNTDDLGGDVDHDYYYLTQEKWLIVESTLSNAEVPEDFIDESPFRVPSSLCKRFYIEDGYRVLPASSIVAPAYCVQVPSTKDGCPLNEQPEIFQVYETKRNCIHKIIIWV